MDGKRWINISSPGWVRVHATTDDNDTDRCFIVAEGSDGTHEKEFNSLKLEKWLRALAGQKDWKEKCMGHSMFLGYIGKDPLLIKKITSLIRKQCKNISQVVIDRKREDLSNVSFSEWNDGTFYVRLDQPSPLLRNSSHPPWEFVSVPLAKPSSLSPPLFTMKRMPSQPPFHGMMDSPGYLVFRVTVLDNGRHLFMAQTITKHQQLLFMIENKKLLVLRIR